MARVRLSGRPPWGAPLIADGEHTVSAGAAVVDRCMALFADVGLDEAVSRRATTGRCGGYLIGHLLSRHPFGHLQSARPKATTSNGPCGRCWPGSARKPHGRIPGHRRANRNPDQTHDGRLLLSDAAIDWVIDAYTRGAWQTGRCRHCSWRFSCVA